MSACGDDGGKDSLRIAGIPDQNAADLARKYGALTDYLSEKLGVEVEYVPTVDYAATVTAFKQDDVQLAWFGGLTGAVARLEVPGSEAIAQRPRDEQFHSVFIANAGVEVTDLASADVTVDMMERLYDPRGIEGVDADQGRDYGES